MEAERQELTRSLLAVVEQASAPVEARRQAILLLGQLATPKAVAWLNGHLNLYLPKAAYRCDDDRFKEYPALYALGDAGWAAVPVLLDRLAARPCNREQLLVMAEVFRRTCGHETARLLIKARAEQNKAGPLAANTARLEPLLNE